MRDLSQTSHAPILILGGSGMLGSDLFRYFQPRFGERVLSPTHGELNATDFTALENYLRRHRPAVVLNAIAYTNVDRAEVEREAATLLNAELPRRLAEGSQALGYRLVHFSTDYVFSGEGSQPWTEDDLPNPPTPNHYAHSKLVGELAVRAITNSLTLRVQWLYGEQKDRFSVLKSKSIFTPFSDQFGAPTWTREIAETVGELLARDSTGLFHFAYDDAASWAEVYEFVKSEWDLPLQLIPKLSAEVILPARRPRFGVLSNAKLKKALGVETMGSWKEPLRKFLFPRALMTPTSSLGTDVRR